MAFAIHEHINRFRGPQSEFLLPPGGEAEKYILRKGYPYKPYDLEGLSERGVARPLAESARIGWRINCFRTGLLHIYSPFVYGALSKFLSVSPFKTVLHIQLDYSAEELEWPLQYPPDLIVVCARTLLPVVEGALQKSSHKSTRVVEIPNAVDTERFFPADRREAKKKCGADPDRPLLLMAANIAPHKGQETALRSLAMLRRRGCDAVLWMAGEERESDGNYLGFLKGLAGELEVGDRAAFLGFRKDVPELMRAADLFLLPSSREGLPLAVLEAQASKAAVLAAPTAGIPEAIDHERTGFLIPEDDFAAYAEKIAYLLENREVMERMTEAAHDGVARHFSMARYCERVLEEYDRLLPRRE